MSAFRNSWKESEAHGVTIGYRGRVDDAVRSRGRYGIDRAPLRGYGRQASEGWGGTPRTQTADNLE